MHKTNKPVKKETKRPELDRQVKNIKRRLNMKVSEIVQPGDLINRAKARSDKLASLSPKKRTAIMGSV